RLLFFSSRRRHTRFSRDWSSDVCSSDLARWDGELPDPVLAAAGLDTVFTANNRTLPADEANAYGRMWMRPLRANRIAALLERGRSEERRVGNGVARRDGPHY